MSEKYDYEKDYLENKQKRRLKNFFLDPRFQMKFIFWVSSTGLTLIIAYSVIFYLYTQENYALFVDLIDMTGEARTQLDNELIEIILAISGLGLLFLVITSLTGIVYSHKIVGPVYNMKKTINAILEGDYSRRVRLRPKDEFHDVADSFNEMMDLFEDKLKK